MAPLSSRRFFAAVFGIFVCVGKGLGSGISEISPRACAGTVTAQAGDTCSTLAQAYGISVSQFLLDNPTIDSCSELIVGQEYCISEDGSGPPDVPPASSTTSSSSDAAPTTKVSDDGSCGNGVSCLGSEFGDCCSEHGYCGSTANYCAAGCQSDFGKCDGSVSEDTTTQPTSAPDSTTSTPISSPTSAPTSTPTNPPDVSTATATVTKTEIVTATVWTTSTATDKVVETTTSTAIVAPPATSTVIQTSISAVVTTSTSRVLETSTVVKTATRTQVISAINSDCNPVTSTTRPDTPITTTLPSQPDPSPTLPGIVSTCREYYQIRGGDDCVSIASKNGISMDQFARWNPSLTIEDPGGLGGILCGLLGSCEESCEGLREGYYACVSA